ncbi:universal stress protein [Qipengyuania sp. GH38]|uniref:universal stress protein n=1 Tax=Qipengyuania intermedia TaxID=2867244 RepID=UPI001C871297|nr:universal stress protein [Qipengyuania intermedia]MBX7515224.1 universal stress protein [Qipengyuania intermedia]
MRIYLVVMDETEESKQALRFASLRAMKTNGSVHILALVPQQTFNAFGGVQATIEQEARERAEVLANSAAGNIFGEMGKMPVIAVRPGAPADVIRTYLEEHGEVAALVLGTTKDGGKDPLVQHFSARASELPCPLYIVPGKLTREQLDALA